MNRYKSKLSHLGAPHLPSSTKVLQQLKEITQLYSIREACTLVRKPSKTAIKQALRELQRHLLRAPHFTKPQMVPSQ